MPGPEGWPYPPWLAAHALEPSYQWAFKAWDKAAAAPGAWFDQAKADRVVELWPTWFTLTDDRFAGVPFKLLPWQEIIVRLLVGWKAPVEIIDPVTHQPAQVHVRVFQRLLLWIPRKNGKTEFLSALGLLFWAIEGLYGGQAYVFARDEDQAQVPFRKMKAMIAFNAKLAADVQVHAKSLWLKTRQALCELLTGAELGKHGKSPSVTIGDEMHEWRSREVEKTLHDGQGVRLQPIELYASTTGRKTNTTGVELWDESRAILDGTLDDAATLVAIFAAEPDDDWQDEAAWRRANPSLGLTLPVAVLRREAKLAEGNPRREAEFRCYHLNQWVEGSVRWINLKKWDACATADKTAWASRLEAMRGRRAFGAFDVSSTKDVTALVWLFPPTDEDPQWRLACRFWVPEATLEERVKADRVPYDRFRAAGAIETTPGDYVDQNFVAQAIREGLEMFDVVKVAFDPWNARKLITDLEAGDDERNIPGIPIETFVEMRQGIQTLGEPSKHFERLVYAGLLDHGGHPVLRWMAGNVVVRFDENLNFAPAKKRSAEKIDGIVAAVMATGLACAGQEDDGVYRGLYEQIGATA